MTTNIYTTYNVSNEQVAAAHRFTNESNGRVFFKVESASEVGTEYTVYYNRELKHLVCDCKAGQVGTPCWHKRAALAAAAEYRQERNERNERDMMELQTSINEECAMWARINAAPAQVATTSELAQAQRLNDCRTFRLMR